MRAWIVRLWQRLTGRRPAEPKPPTGPSAEQIDLLMRDFALRYHNAPPFAAVGVAVPAGWDLRSFTTEALKRYPDITSAESRR